MCTHRFRNLLQKSRNICKHCLRPRSHRNVFNLQLSAIDVKYLLRVRGDLYRMCEVYWGCGVNRCNCKVVWHVCALCQCELSRFRLCVGHARPVSFCLQRFPKYLLGFWPWYKSWGQGQSPPIAVLRVYLDASYRETSDKVTKELVVGVSGLRFPDWNCLATDSGLVRRAPTSHLGWCPCWCVLLESLSHYAQAQLWAVMIGCEVLDGGRDFTGPQQRERRVVLLLAGGCMGGKCTQRGC